MSSSVYRILVSLSFGACLEQYQRESLYLNLWGDIVRITLHIPYKDIFLS